MKNSDYVQFGCGFSAPEGWVNFDASPTLRFERLPLLGRMWTRNEARFPTSVKFGDIVKGLPLKPASCAGIYCSHVLEHLSLQDFRIALINTFLLLKAGGIFRLVVPDLERSIGKYYQDSTPGAAETFLSETGLGRKSRNRRLAGFLVEWLGNSHHLWMWDYKSIEQELTRAGFAAVRRACLGDSADRMFDAVEDEGRWQNCLGVECRRQ